MVSLMDEVLQNRHFLQVDGRTGLVAEIEGKIFWIVFKGVCCIFDKLNRYLITNICN